MSPKSSSETLICRRSIVLMVSSLISISSLVPVRLSVMLSVSPPGEAPSLPALGCSTAFSACLVAITPPYASGIACSQQTPSRGPVSHDALLAPQRNLAALRAQRRGGGAGARARFLGRRTHLERSQARAGAVVRGRRLRPTGPQPQRAGPRFGHDPRR